MGFEFLHLSSTCSEHHVDITVSTLADVSNLTHVLHALICCRKELKDPDQLYSTLKTILQHVKVRELQLFLLKIIYRQALI